MNNEEKIRILSAVVALIIVMMALQSASASAAQQIPKIVPYVNDFSGLMTKEQIATLNLFADSIENQTSWEIAIVTVPNTQGDSRVNFANRIGDENGVGKKGLSNGLVVLWSQDNERGGAIATGRGSEGLFNDAKVGEIGRASRHYFDEGKYYDGFSYILGQINDTIVKSDYNKSGASSLLGDGTSDNLSGIIFFVFAILIVITLLIMFGVWIDGGSSRSYDDDDDKDDDDSGYHGSGSGSRGGSSGGGGGFGGGGFGGGGAGF